jgi:pimeloyl-ACP methyl ester carboxylesterase
VAAELIPGCGHTPHLEKPDAVLAAISAFIEDRIKAID